MPLLKTDAYTTDYIYNLPDGQRAELIDGRVYDMAPPSRIHQELLSELHYKIREYIEKSNGSCKVYPAPFAVFLNKDDHNYVEPDISVICDSSKLDSRGCNGAPDWIIEIVSPGGRRMDYSTKLFKYRSAGVREYWLVDPDKDRIMVWYFETDNAEEYTFKDCVVSNIYGDLSIDFSKLGI